MNVENMTEEKTLEEEEWAKRLSEKVRIEKMSKKKEKIAMKIAEYEKKIQEAQAQIKLLTMELQNCD